MSTQSFDRTFTVTDRKAIKKLNASLAAAPKTLVRQMDVKTESMRGIAILKHSLSASKTQLQS
jgi:hypothetical protein